RYAANVTGAIARRNDPNVGSAPLTVAPQFFGNLRLSYAPGGNLPIFAVAGHYLAKRPAGRVAAFDPPAFAHPLFELRATLSGPLPIVKGLSSRASANYVFGDHGAYVIGPIQGIGIGEGGYGNFVGKPELSPVDRFRATVGIQYDFGGSQ